MFGTTKRDARRVLFTAPADRERSSKRVGIRIAAHEAAIQLRRIFAVAARKDSIAETAAYFAAEDAAAAGIA